MKRFTILVISAVFSLLVVCLSACSEEGNNQEHSANSGHDHQETGNASSPEELAISNEQAGQILAAYLKVKDALVQTDGTTAQAAAADLLAILETGEDDLLASMRMEVANMATSDDPTTQREHLLPLSELAYQMLQVTDASEATVYKQYCPMAFNNTGAFWLAAEKEVNNPYFGDMMLHCGKVEEEI